MAREWELQIASVTDLMNGKLRQIANPAHPVRTTMIFPSANTTDVAACLTTQVMYSVGIVLRKGDVISKIGVQFGATAAGTPTNWWFALYDDQATPALLGQTADQTSTAIGANSYQEAALQTAQLIDHDGLYNVGVMVKATTVPSMLCAVAATAKQHHRGKTGVPALAQTSGSSLTATAPSTIASPSDSANYAIGIILS
jgi:hypothetical protein